MACSKVLVVEDDPLARMTAAEALRDAGHTVVEASSGDAAAEILAREPRSFAVVFSDIDMPGVLDGLGLAQAVVDQWPEVAVVLTSGYATPSPEALSSCVRFVRKPYELADIAEIVGDFARPQPDLRPNRNVD